MEPQQCPVSDFSVSPARLVPNAVSGSGVRAKLERRQSEGTQDLQQGALQLKHDAKIQPLHCGLRIPPEKYLRLLPCNKLPSATSPLLSYALQRYSVTVRDSPLPLSSDGVGELVPVV